MKYKLYGKTGTKEPILIDQSNELQSLVDQAEYFLVKGKRYDTCWIQKDKKDIWWSDIDLISSKVPSITDLENLIKITCEEKYEQV